MKFLLVLCVTVVSTVAYKCCVPKQMEGNVGHFGGYYQDGSGGGVITGLTRVHYDFYAEKIATVDFDNRIINDFNTSTQYIIVKEEHCWKAELPGTYDDFTCIPDNAIDLGPLVLGIDVLYGRTYGVQTTFEDTNVTQYVTVTEDDCVTVVVDYISNGPETTQIQCIGFYDFTLGFKDPSVFDVPEICNGVETVAAKDAPKLGSHIMQWIRRTGYQ
ncbi:ependymin-related protein 1-like [Ptychodera flava]|uniref:ependymin-related protein 1-like n=1 Tax=Ptychodera flava TaxID=63121 RepID=UPI00396A49C5